MAKNIKKHICTDNCKGRTNSVSCFLCGEIFYSKCFSLDAQTQVKINSIDSCVRFICGICQSSYTANKRKSLNNSQLPTNASSITDNNNALNDNINKILDLLLTRAPGNTLITNAPSNSSDKHDNSSINVHQSIANNLNDKIDTVASDLKVLILSINEMKKTRSDFECDQSQQKAPLHDKLDNCISIVTKLDNIIEDNIIKSLSDLHCKIDLNISDPQFMTKHDKFTHKPQQKTNRNGRNSLSNDFEWSFSFNQSLNAATSSENTELYSLLSSFEQNTWAGLDLLREKVINIETMCKNFELNELQSANSSAPSHSGQPIASALIDSIELDALAQIQNKCENIDRNVNLIMARTKSQWSQSLSKPFNIRDETPRPRNTLPESTTVSADETSVNEASTVHSHALLNETVYFPNDMLNGEINSLVNRSDAGSVLDCSQNTQNSIRIESIHDISGDHIAGNSASTDITVTDNATSAGSDISSVDAAKLYELHLTKLPVDITECDIVQYIAKKGVLNADSIKLHKLVKRNADLSSFSFVSFKIDTTESIAKRLCERHFWPDKCIIKNFVHKNVDKKRPIASTVASAQNFRLPIDPSIQTI